MSGHEHRWDWPQVWVGRQGENVLVTSCLGCNAFMLELVAEPERTGQWLLDRLAVVEELRP